MQRLHTICRKYQNLAAALLLLHCTAPHRTSFCRVRHACIECPHETCAHARALSLNRCCVFIDTVLLTRLTLFVPPKSAFTTRYIKLAKGALELLPSVEMTVYRGIRDVSLKKLLNGEDVNGILTWWAFTSTTGTSDVLRDPTFFGIGSEHGDRVVFKIQIKKGVRIKQFSEFGGDENYYLTPFGVEAPVNEDEVMILPGTRFRITAINTYTNNVTEIEMHELADDGGNADSARAAVVFGGRAQTAANDDGTRV